MLDQSTGMCINNFHHRMPSIRLHTDAPPAMCGVACFPTAWPAQGVITLLNFCQSDMQNTSQYALNLHTFFFFFKSVRADILHV